MVNLTQVAAGKYWARTMALMRKWRITNFLQSCLSAWARAVALIQRWRVGSRLAVALVIAAVSSGVATGIVLTGSFGASPDRTTVDWLMDANLALLLALGALVTISLVNLLVERRRGSTGSRLQVRLVRLFCIVAITPTLVVAIFTVLFFNLGLQSWFNDRTSLAVHNALTVASAYLEEHKRLISGDLLAMANDLNRNAYIVGENPRRFVQLVGTQAQLRSLSEAMVVDGSGRVLARAGVDFNLVSDRVPFIDELREAQGGEVVFVDTANDRRVSAVVMLDGLLDAYLYVARPIDPLVISYADSAASAAAEYVELEGERSYYEASVRMIFVTVALLVLLSAIWFGLRYGFRFASPIGSLAGAAARVGDGDFSVRVDNDNQEDEIGVLADAFNHMTGQLERQRTDLVEANRELEERRRFTETVLSGVTAGVIGLDANRMITLPNKSAQELLGRREQDLVGRRFRKAVPELAHLVEEASGRPARTATGEVEIDRGGKQRRLIARVAPELENRIITGYVVTFDDITDLVTAQRLAAWGDVARRIAHEIKNPLTPIQLSADRLRSNYAADLAEDDEIFEQCTSTIIRQVNYLERMVDEFAEFARLAKPVLKEENLSQIVHEAVFMQQTRTPEIACEMDLPKEPVPMQCDARQMSQLLTNLLKNADEALKLGVQTGARDIGESLIRVTLELDDEGITLGVMDNGPGFPDKDRHRLVEPYVTTREKGTGLGLAIVKRIIEEHEGQLTLENAEQGGASVEIRFFARQGKGRMTQAAAGQHTNVS